MLKSVGLKKTIRGLIEHKIFTVSKETPKERNRKSNKSLGLFKTRQAKII